jgi:hypothetical protein
VVVVLHAAKFARFVRPILAHLDPAEVVVAWSTEDVAGELTRTGVSIVEAPGRGPAELVRRTMQGTDSPSAFDAMTRLLDDVQPRAVLVVEGNHPWDETANRAARQAGIGCYCLQQGWSPIVHSGFRNMTFESMLVWGAGFAKLLEPFNPDQRFVSTGNPALDGLDVAGPRPSGLPDTTGRTVVSFFLQPTSQVLGADGLSALLEVIVRFAERHPSSLALVREHPGFPLTEAERTRLSARDNVWLIAPHQVPLGDVLRATDVSVAIYSTTILESIASLVPPIVLNTTSMPRYSPDVAAAGAGVEVRDANAALSVLDRLVDDAAYRASFNAPMELFRDTYFSNVGSDAAAAVASILEHVPA